MSDGVLACLREMAGQDIAVGLSKVFSDDGLLDPEPEAIASAIQKRRSEFAAGRRAARHALEIAGLDPTPIPQGEHRAPVWPEGVVGSISHDAGLAVAAVASKSRVSRLGLDMTEAAPFPDHLRKEVLLTPAEAAQSALEARLSFSAKESVFKAFYPDVRRYFGFGAVEVLPNLETGQFGIKLRRPLGEVPAGSTFRGRCTLIDGRMLTLFSTKV